MHRRVRGGFQTATDKLRGALSTLTAYNAISSAFRNRFADATPNSDIVNVSVHTSERVIQVQTHPNPSDETMAIIDELREHVESPWAVSHIDYKPAESR